jgi:isoquinoline 1-oxidoreductase beta subunit
MGELTLASGSPLLGRRAFLRAAGVAAGVFSLEFALFGEAAAAVSSGSATAAPAQHVLNAYVSIHPDNSIVLFAKNPDCGQGIKTTFGMILAEELDADWNKVHVEQAPVAAAYGTQSSGGSNSTPTNWDTLRLAGATARAMLVNAAAMRWRVPVSSLATRDSVVVHAASGRRVTYGELAAAAATQPVPDPASLVLKRRADFRLLGTRVGNVDNHSVVTGAPIYAIDVDLPGMLHATLERCPACGGKPVSANLDEIRALPGITAAFFVTGWPTSTATRDAKEPPGVAIVGTSTWAVFSARKKLKVVWDETGAASESWSELTKRAKALVGTQGPMLLRAGGSVEGLAGKRVSAFYTYATAAHATLEPQNATASWKDGKIEIWAPTQTPTAAVAVVAASLRIKPEDITLHVCRLGGGFGRRLVNDYVCEAAVISRVIGAPVKLQWTREDDMRHDYFRAGGFHVVDGWLDGKGRLAGWQNHFITMTLDGKSPVTGGALRATEFPATLLANHRITQTMFPVGTAFGSWRAPGSNAWAFVSQSFVHELAVAAGRDHLEFLLEMFRNAPPPKPDIPDNELNPLRAIAVTREVARRAGWGSKQPAGQALGLAFYFSHRGHFAEVVRVSVDARKKITVHEVWVVGDIGPVLNRSGAEAQVQGSVIDAVSVMMAQRIDIENGRVRQSNFDNYPLLRMPGAPSLINVHCIESDRSPTGCGEPALPPLAPAVCNALFTLTGERIRELPLSNLGYSI